MFGRRQRGLTYWLAAAALWLAGCGDQELVRLPSWALQVAGSDRATEVVLPAHIDHSLPARRAEYRLRTEVELPPAWRGQPLTLSIPYFPALVTASAGGVTLARLELEDDTGFRTRGPQAWRIPAAVTEAALLPVELIVDHRWTRSAWLDTVPRISHTEGPDRATRLVGDVNDWISGWGAASLATISFFCLILFLFDRRRVEYGWLALQACFPAYYLLFVRGVTQQLAGSYDVNLLGLSISGAIIAATYATHASFGLPRPSSLVMLPLVAVNLIACLVAPGPFRAVTYFAPVVVMTMFAGMIYQTQLSLRLVRHRRGDVAITVNVLSWVVLAITTFPDGLAWLGLAEPLGGIRLGPAGLALFTFFQFFGLSRNHLVNLRATEQLNRELNLQMELLGARQQEIETLNEELRRQVAERAQQLSDVLARLGHGSRHARSLEPGELVEGRYRIERTLGEGGSGTVYQVVRVSDGRRFALKALVDTNDALAMARFAREAQLASGFEHPNVVGIVDVDFSSSGFMYLVMEYVEGAALSQIEPPDDLGWKLHVLGEVATGLAAIHREEIVHRDIKPANILLVGGGDGALPAVKISDFGVSSLAASGCHEPVLDQAALAAPPARAVPPARVDISAFLRPASEITPTTPVVLTFDPEQRARLREAAARPRRSELTGAGLLIGTPRYMAPELSRGGGDPSPRADVFSFGVLAYELLAGQKPFREPPCLSVLRRHTLEPALPLAEQVAGLPASLGVLLDRCLAFEPGERPTAAELVEQFAGESGDRPEPDQPPPDTP